MLTCRASYEPTGFDDSVVGWRLDLDEFPTTREAITTGEVIVIPDLGATRRVRPGASAWSRDFGYRSEVCVPLMVDGHGARPDRHVRRRATRLRGRARLPADRRAGGRRRVAQGPARRTAGRRQPPARPCWSSRGSSSGRASTSTRSCARSPRRCAPSPQPTPAMSTASSATRWTSLMSVDGAVSSRRRSASVTPPPVTPPARAAIATRLPFVIEDAETDPRLTDADRHYWLALGLPASVRLPLVAHDEVIGLVSLFDDASAPVRTPRRASGTRPDRRAGARQRDAPRTRRRIAPRSCASWSNSAPSSGSRRTSKRCRRRWLEGSLRRSTRLRARSSACATACSRARRATTAARASTRSASVSGSEAARSTRRRSRRSTISRSSPSPAPTNPALPMRSGVSSRSGDSKANSSCRWPSRGGSSA